MSSNPPKNGTAEFTAASLAGDHIPNLSHNPHWLNTDFAFEPENPRINLNLQPAMQTTNDLLIYIYNYFCLTVVQFVKPLQRNLQGLAQHYQICCSKVKLVACTCLEYCN